MIKIRRVISVILCIVTLMSCFPMQVAAAEGTKSTDDMSTVAEVGGYLSANKKALQNMKTEAKFLTETGHGFAAEKANNLYDVYSGKNATVVGDNNAKNGADRLIINRDGSKVWIQDKYYKTASASVNACFDDIGMFRYYDADGIPMQIEVPADQYDDAVTKMANKIGDGKIKGVTDPEQAKSIVKRGKLTYNQAVNITKAGNVDSLKYDAHNGVIVATAAVGISFLLDYAVCLINGEDSIEALETASINGLKMGGTVFCTYVISSQLTKTGAVQALAPTSEAVAKVLGKDVAKSILQTNGISTAGMSAANRTTVVANVIKNQAIFAGVTVMVLSTGDVIEVFQGRISKEQLLSNLAVTVAGVAGGTAGYYIGGALGTLICPGVGTGVGSLIGGIVGGTSTSLAAKRVAGRIYEGDAQMMYDIIVEEFQAMAVDYLVIQEEAEKITVKLQKLLSESELKNLFESDDRTAYAKKMMEPLFEKEVARREKVETPSEEEIRTALKTKLQGVALVH